MSCGFYLYKGTLTLSLWSLPNCDLFTLSVQFLVTLSLFQLRPFHLECPDPGHGTRNCVRVSDRIHHNLMFLVPVVDLCSTSHFLIVCVDRPGTLSGSAFNQLKVTINKVLTILYLHKTVLQKVFVTVSLYISPAKSSNIYSRRPHCNIK